MTTSFPYSSAWITGAGKGIGRALAQLLCRQGLYVYVSARTENDLLSLKAECSGMAGQILPVPLNITCRDQIARCMEQWDQGPGLPELVVLNAGTHDPFPAQAFSAERCQQLLDINLQGTINCIEPVLQRYLSRHQGHLVVMASSAGYRGLPTAAAYGASKAALINLCEALYLDLKDTDIRLQLVCPGFVRTPLTDRNSFDMPALMEAEEAAQRLARGLLSQRFEIIFPRRFVYVLKCLRILPYRWYFALVHRMIKTPQQEPHHG